MKKIFAFAVVFAAATTSFAQHEAGFKFGYSHVMNNFVDPVVSPTTTVTPTFESKAGGYQFGGYYAFTPLENFYLQAEVLFSNRMWNEVSSVSYPGQVTTTNERHVHYSNNYLQLPLVAKYGINMRRTRYGGNKYLFFYAGPSFHLMMTSKGTIQETFRVDAQNQTTVIQDEREFTSTELGNHFNSFQAGGLAGVQFNFEFGLNIDLRYQLLMMPTTVNDPTQGGLEEPTLKQSMATITLGYSFLRD